MAPVPAEIDLFSGPHSRMKELVNTYSHKVQCVDFRNCRETMMLVKELQKILIEFKSHEWIENMFIMDELKNRLKQRQIYNSAVCNCHKDNRISKMLSLVNNSSHLKKSSVGERINFGEHLQRSFSDFVQEFLPHMEEEEKIFQPLLIEHFEYEELKILNEAVLKQHELIKDPKYQEKSHFDLPEFDSAIKEFRDIDFKSYSFDHLFIEIPSEYACSSSDEDSFCQQYGSLSLCKTLYSENVEFDWNLLPTEVMVNILSYLTPPDRGRCAQVCSRWNEVVYSSPLWKVIYPVQWARGIWSWNNANLSFELEDGLIPYKTMNTTSSWKYDEDADIDEADTENCVTYADVSSQELEIFSSMVAHLLSKIGKFVEKVVLDAGTWLKSNDIQQLLKECPNIEYLSCSYTSFDWLSMTGLQLQKLKYLDLQGCTAVDDTCLSELGRCLGTSLNKSQNTLGFVTDSNSSSCPYLYDGSKCSLLGTNCPLKSPSFSHPACQFNSSDHLTSSASFAEKDYSNQFPDFEDLYSSNFNSRSAPSLHHLNLSGCYKVSDQGLMALLRYGALENLSYLNLSSCFNVSGYGLNDIATFCQFLYPENLTYCNSIINGPFPSYANGCDNIGHPVKICCQEACRN